MLCFISNMPRKREHSKQLKLSVSTHRLVTELHDAIITDMPQIKGHITKHEVELVLKALAVHVVDCLIDGVGVSINGFGSFVMSCEPGSYYDAKFIKGGIKDIPPSYKIGFIPDPKLMSEINHRYSFGTLGLGVEHDVFQKYVLKKAKAMGKI